MTSQSSPAYLKSQKAFFHYAKVRDEAARKRLNLLSKLRPIIRKDYDLIYKELSSLKDPEEIKLAKDWLNQMKKTLDHIDKTIEKLKYVLI